MGGVEVGLWDWVELPAGLWDWLKLVTDWTNFATTMIVSFGQTP